MKRKKEPEGNVITQEALTKVFSKVKIGKALAHKVMGYSILKCVSNSEIVMKILAKFYTKVIQNNITLKQWKKAIAIMLEKGKSPQINKLQINQLISSDLQSLMRATIIPVANAIVDENKLNLSQYARKQATTMSALVEKRLFWNQLYLPEKRVFG